MTLFWLFACGYSYFTSLREPAPPGATVTWQGYVFQNPDALEDEVLTDGELTVSADGESFPFSQPFEEYPGYWYGEVPVGAEVALTIRGSGLRPARWGMTTPSGDGIWFSGALFGVQETWLLTLLEGLLLQETIDGAVLVWGAPLDGGTWDCADVTVNGAPVSCFSLDEAGAVAAVDSGPFTWFFSLDVPAGPITVSTGDVSFTYQAETREVVLAHWFEGSP